VTRTPGRAILLAAVALAFSASAAPPGRTVRVSVEDMSEKEKTYVRAFVPLLKLEELTENEIQEREAELRGLQEQVRQAQAEIATVNSRLHAAREVLLPAVEQAFSSRVGRLRDVGIENNGRGEMGTLLLYEE